MRLSHSYSSLKQFDNCSKQYYEVRILKKYKSQETEATQYGTLVHSAFEEYIRDKKELPESFSHYAKYVEPLARIEGDIYCEHKLGLRPDFSPCGFFDKDVWFRGVPDFLAVNRETGVARVGDYKTGKSSRFADTDQLELMAAMVMQHFPEVNKVKGALIFVVAQDIVKAEFTREQLPEILSKWGGKASMIEKVIEKGVVSARPSGLCKFCPCECPHNSKG
jgi:RecB family exonuclease